MAWSDLPVDLLCCIASQLHVVDFLRFSITCTSWKSALAKDSLLRIRSLPSPWLLLPSDAGEASDTLTFRDLIREEDSVVCHRRFSSLGIHISGRRCVGSKDGWLVTLDKTDLQPRLLNPLTKAERSLPSLFTIPEDKWHRIAPCSDPNCSLFFSNQIITRYYAKRERFRKVYFQKIVLSSNDPLGTAVVIYGYVKFLAFARPGDQAWALAPQPPPHQIHDTYVIEDVCYHEEDRMFYAITRSSAVLAYDLNGQNVILICPEMQCWDRRYYSKYYITFWSGTLLKIDRTIESVENEIADSRSGKTVEISVFKLVSPIADPCCSFSEWSSVKDLGGFSIFIGCNHTLSLHPMAAPGIKPNCIYFKDDWEQMSSKDFDRDAGLFDLQNDSFQYFLDSESQPNWPTSIWFTPSFL